MSDSHGGVGQLLLGEVEGVVGHRDAIEARVLSCRKVPPQDSVAANAEEGHQTVPRHIVEPHLHRLERTLRHLRREASQERQRVDRCFILRLGFQL